jgi:hypothetical protein
MLIDIYFVIRVITEAGTVYTSGSHEIIPVLMGFLLLMPFVSDKIRTPPLLCTSPLQNLDEYAPIQGKIACHSSRLT